MSKLKHRVEGRRQGGNEHMSQLKDLCFLYLEKDHRCFIHCMERYIFAQACMCTFNGVTCEVSWLNLISHCKLIFARKHNTVRTPPIFLTILMSA